MFLKTIFYATAILPIIWEGYCLSNNRKVKTFVDQLKEKDTSLRTDTEKTFSYLMFGYMFWLVIGVMTTYNWPIFMTIVLYSFIPKENLIVRWLDSFVSLILISFAFVNAFHLKIDIFRWLINL